MALKRSPGGSIFPYPYKGGELFGLHLGSFRGNEEGLLERMKAEETFILETHRQFPLWIDFYQDRLTDRVLLEFLKTVGHTRNNITKLALVGFSFWDRIRLRRLVKKTSFEFPMPLRFFSDPEVAKTWLVSDAS
ncbi:MAG TPA: hypothetical protein VMC09_07860 [Anaerolineales bacterium]|nr:hypothetical protein [Anaerolineales bacterium]